MGRPRVRTAVVRQGRILPRSAATRPGLAPAGSWREPPWFTGVTPRGSTEPQRFDESRPRPEPPRLSRANPLAEGRSASPRRGEVTEPFLGVNHGGSTGITRRGSVEPRWFARSKSRPDPPRLGRVSAMAVPWCEPRWFAEASRRDSPRCHGPGRAEPRWFARPKPHPDPPRLGRTNRPAEGTSGPSRQLETISPPLVRTAVVRRGTVPRLGVNRGGSPGRSPVPIRRDSAGSPPWPSPGANHSGSPRCHVSGETEPRWFVPQHPGGEPRWFTGASRRGSTEPRWFTRSIPSPMTHHEGGPAPWT
jgi:hypothetical protein